MMRQSSPTARCVLILLVSFLVWSLTHSCLQVTCVGHIIGLVVADTQLHAQRAAKAVRIQYEELQPIITIQVSHLCADLDYLLA